MWEKGFRVVTFAAVYETIYWFDDSHRSEIDIHAITESYEVDLTESDSKKVLQLVEEFKEKKEEFYATIESFTTDWKKTYDLVRAIMCTALLELVEIKDITTQDQKKKIVNKYVQIAQDMIGGNNPNLVYAIVGKIYGV